MLGPGCCSSKSPGVVAVVVEVAAAVVVVVGVRYCLLEIGGVQILSQGDCQAKNLTISRILYVSTHVAALVS